MAQKTFYPETEDKRIQLISLKKMGVKTNRTTFCVTNTKLSRHALKRILITCIKHVPAQLCSIKEMIMFG